MLAYLTPRWLKRAVAWVLGAVAFFYVSKGIGQRQARLDALVKQAERNANAAKQSKDIRRDVETQDDKRLADLLSGGMHEHKR
jgi:hypothetical protein